MDQVIGILFGLILLAAVLAIVFALPILILVKLCSLERQLGEIKQKLVPPPEAKPQALPVAATVPKPAVAPVPAIPKPAAAPLAAKAEPIQRITPPPAPPTPSALETRTMEVLCKIKNWIVVGNESGEPGVTREYAVATTWLVRIGILVLVVGAGLFLKYSIDHNWLRPAVRVVSMALTGAALATFGLLKCHGKYRNLSIALAGGGFLVLQLSVLAAFRLYQLIPALPAFLLMAAITAAAMTAALVTDTLLIAVIGAIGGYLAPVLIDTGHPDAVKLLIYLAILTAGVLFSAYYRSWVLLHLLALVSCAMLGLVAVNKGATAQNAAWILALSTLIYLLFAQLPLETARRRDATIFEIILMVGNVLFYFIAAIPVADNHYAAWKVPAAVPFAAFLIAVLQFGICRRGRLAERPVLKTFLAALAAVSLALVVPLLLDGIWITAAWSVLAFVLLYTAEKHRSGTLLLLAVFLYFGTLFYQLISGYGFEDKGGYLANLGRHLATAGIFIASLAGAAWRLFGKSAQEWFAPSCGDSKRVPAWLFSIAAAGGFFWYTSFELDALLRQILPQFRNGGVTVWWSILACAALFIGIRRGVKVLRIVGALLFVVCAGKIFLIDLAHLGQVWRIAVLAVTGPVILSGAVLYMRFKHLFVTGNKK
jgi:uncharacterized membrane protein